MVDLDPWQNLTEMLAVGFGRNGHAAWYPW